MPFELVPHGTHIDFIGKRHLCAVLSLALILAGAVAVPLRGVRFGIDFDGGTEVQVRFSEPEGVDEGRIRSVVGRCGISESSVVRYGDDPGEFLLRFRQLEGGEEAAPEPEDCPLSEADRAELAEEREAADVEGTADQTGELVERLSRAMANELGPLEVDRVEFVGPRVGAELRQDGLRALFWASFFILIYVAFRFSLRFAPGAIVALLHDVIITAGMFVIFGLEFDLRVLAALLAIIGYSLNDTIIIYDRIRENMEVRTKHDLIEVLNLSVNQTLSRTLLTSGTTMAAVLALLFLGGEVIRPFALAMSIGIVVGTYSSVFIAAPTLLFLEQRFGSDDESSGKAGKGKGPRSSKRKSGKSKKTRAA